MKECSKKKILFIVLSVILICVIAYVLITKMNKKTVEKKTENSNINEKINDEETQEKLKILDINSKSRPYAVMINNLSIARPYQSGLQDAYLVYEMIVEGGITRLMAVFKDKDTSRVGPIRSSRHYYLDYAMENDAIYVHFGWSPLAKSNIEEYKINNINGLYDDFFWREDLPIAYEHTAFSSLSNIIKKAKEKNYRSETNKKLLLNYSKDEINLNDNEGSIDAKSVDIRYSNSVTTNYIYNKNDKLYYRSVNDTRHVDYKTKKQYTAKNILVVYVSNETITGDVKGRQTLNNIGTGSGYYITNGVAVPITWNKKSRTEQTIYKYQNGEEIVVNDGNTYIQIAPINSATIK